MSFIRLSTVFFNLSRSYAVWIGREENIESAYLTVEWKVMDLKIRCRRKVHFLCVNFHLDLEHFSVSLKKTKFTWT